MAEKTNPFCGKEDADIKTITAGKDKLKSLMSGDLSNLDGMEEAQKQMKKGFDLLSGKSVGPVELCVCKYYDESLLEVDDNFNPIMPTNEAECNAAFGSWVCRTVENFSLQDELGKLGALTDPNAFTAKVADIKAKFANTVPDLNDKVGAVNPSLGDFFKNVKIPELPKVGDQVEQCMCSDPLYTSQAECEAAGGTWECKTVEFKGFGIPGVGDILGGQKVPTLSNFGSTVEGGVAGITKFFSGAIAGSDSAQQQANGAINFGADGKFQIPGVGSISDATSFLQSKIPAPGELVDVYTCVGGDPLASGKEECLASGGEWRYQGKQPAPDLTNLFGPTGLPKLTPDNICKFVEKIEVKTELKTDPVTGVQTVEPVAKTAPEKPVVPKEPPKVSDASPPADIDRRLADLQAINSFNRAVTLSLESYMLTFTGEKWNVPKKDAKRVIQVLQYYAWRDFAENVNADFDFVLKIMAIPSVANLTAEKIYAVWVMFYRDYVKKTLTTAGIEKSEKKMYKTWEKMYNKITTSSYTFDVAGLIAWQEALEKSSNANKMVPKYSEPEKVNQNIAIVEEEEPPPAEPAPLPSGKKTINWKGSTITYTEPEVRLDPNNGTLKYYWDTSDKSAFAYISEVRSQKELDEILNIARAQSGTYEVFRTDRSKREYKMVYYGEHVKNYMKWSRRFIKTADGTYK